MRILFLTDNFPPEVSAGGVRTFDHCKEWLKDGHTITIITCVPNHPYGKIFPGYKNKLYQKENIDGIKVIRVWSYMAPNSGFTKRVVDYMSFAFMSFFIGLFQKNDIIIATSPQFFTAWSGWALSKIKRIPWIFEVRDLWPESIKTVGVMKQGRIINLLEKIELGLYKGCNKVIVVTDAFKDNLIKRGIDKNKIEVITNGVNTELFFPRAKDLDLVKKLNVNGKFVIGYIGTHGMAHNLNFIIESIPSIKDNKIVFLFIGDGAMKDKVMLSAKNLKLNNIIFLDSVSKNEVARYLSICDVSLVPLKRSDNFKTVIPSKIFEASAMRIPILLGVVGQAQYIIEKYGAGICFQPENEKDFIEKIMQIKNKKIYKSCQNGCLKLALDFDRKKLANNMLDIVKKITR